jgi:thiamine kinase-like enzyme
VSPLAGGITNRNFLIQVEERDGEVGEKFVLRVAGAGTERLGIDREREHACAVVAAESGAGCEVVAFLPEHHALVVRYAPGAALAPRDLEDETLLARAVAALRQFHAGNKVPGRFSVPLTVAQYLKIAHEGGVPLPMEIVRLATRLQSEMEAIGVELLLPCHNDLLPANLIDDGQRVRLIDWEYAAMGDPWFDLGNLAENSLLSEPAERRLLELYFGKASDENIVRLRQMRFASAMREAAWGFAQVVVSELDFGFADYGQKHLERAKTLSGES